KAWTYWQRQLTGELPLLSLPTDRPRPVVAESCRAVLPDTLRVNTNSLPADLYRGASVAFRLNRDSTLQLKKLAGRQGVTLFTLLLTAYKVLLHRYTHQQDVIVGVPSSGRIQARFASVV